jgi:hypothetical protein
MEFARLATRIWVALFVIDAGVGALQALLSAVGLGSAIGGVAGWTGLVLALATSVYFLVWVAESRVPWWPLWLLGYLSWEAGGFLPLPAVSLDLEASTAWGLMIQALIAAPVVRAALRGQLVRDAVESPRLHSLLRTAVLLAFGVLGFALQLFLVAQSLSIATGGFAKVDLTGVEMGHRTCQRDDGRVVHLVGAVHVGEASGYDALLADIPADALMLAEGVTDDEGHLGTFSYDKLAGKLGLVPQRAAAAEPGSPQAEGDGRFRVRRADVDVSTFSPQTLELLGSIGEALQTEDPMGAWLRKSAELDVNDGLLEGLAYDLLWARNAFLLDVLDEELLREEQLLVPWGALHLRGIQDGVEDRGFDCGRADYVRMLEWRTIWTAVWRR